jgi:hypothetical protein
LKTQAVGALFLFRSTFASLLVAAATAISAARKQTSSEDLSMGIPPQKWLRSNRQQVLLLILINRRPLRPLARILSAVLRVQEVGG